MKIGIVVSYDEKYEALAKISLENIDRYCELWGYYLHVDRQTSPRMNRCGAWNKIIACIEALPQYDWIMFLDIDCLIMNHTIKIEDIISHTEASFIVPAHNIPAVDTPIINEMGTDCVITSQFLVKNSEIGMAILEDIWAAKEWPEGMNINTFDYEGRQVRVTIEKPEFSQHVRVIEEHILNRFWYVNNPYIVFYNQGVNDMVWKPGDFIVHVTNYSLTDRARIMKELDYFSGGLMCGFTRDEKNTIRVSALKDMDSVQINVHYPNRMINYMFDKVLDKTTYLLYAEDLPTTEDAIVKVYAYGDFVAQKFVPCKK